jgi:hypothetical protein
MIDRIVTLLSMFEYLGESELIDIAKGKNKLETTVKGKVAQKKRIKAWR